jgi:Raf kinase inhibitor-like YbhB/YbcL family protein
VKLGMVVTAVLLLTGCGGKAADMQTSPAPVTITVTSAAFGEGGDIPSRHTCDGQNVSPLLRFAAMPSGTVELALLVEDPDASRGTFVHWVAWGIDPGKGELGEGETPPGVGENDFGKRGYGGPCPPKGAAHRYVFTVYALPAHLDLPAGAGADDLKRAVSGRTLAEGRLIGRYARH